MRTRKEYCRQRPRASKNVHLKITARFVAAVVTAAVAPLLLYGLVSIYSLRTGNETSVAEGNLNVARRAAAHGAGVGVRMPRTAIAACG